MTTRMSRPRTFQLIPKADAALDKAVEITGHSRTDVVNRALQLYAYLMEEQAAGAELCLRNGDRIASMRIVS